MKAVSLSDRGIPLSFEPAGKQSLNGFKRRTGYEGTKLSEDTGEPPELGVWSDEKRVEAVTAYVAMGKMPKVALATDIPVNTLWAWKKYSNWWTDLEKTIRGEQNNEYSATISDIVSSSLLAIKDRIKDGDFIYNPRSGETVRVPVSAKSLNQVVNTMLDKRGKLVRENQAETTSDVDEKTLENKLTQLADAFKSFVATKNTPTIDMGEAQQL
jgi:hypothetical protein